MKKTVDWIQTFTGKRVRPLAARAEDIDILDIAHALAHQCRFSGHVRRFYSVAEHCVLVSLEVPPERALDGLLHDSAEAYLVDLPTPIKRMLPGYGRMEDKLFKVIAKRFGASPKVPDVVKLADRRILEFEARALMNGSLEGWELEMSFQAPMVEALSNPLSPEDAKVVFLARFGDIYRNRRMA